MKVLIFFIKKIKKHFLALKMKEKVQMKDELSFKEGYNHPNDKGKGRKIHQNQRGVYVCGAVLVLMTITIPKSIPLRGCSIREFRSYIGYINFLLQS